MASAAQFVMQFFPIFSARRAVRQADGGFGFRDLDCEVHDRAAWAAAGGARGRAGRRDRHLWRGQPVRRLLRPRPDGASIVSFGRDSEAADAGGDRARHDDLHHVGAAWYPGDPERDPDAILGTTPFAAPGLGIIAAIVMFSFGMWWLGRAERSARAKGEGYGDAAPVRCRRGACGGDLVVRERATTASTFDPPEATHGRPSDVGPPIALAALPLVIVVVVNLLMSFLVLPRTDASFLADKTWGSTSLAAVGGVWAVVTALAAAIVVLIAINFRGLPALRDSMDAGPTPPSYRL